MGIAEPPWSRQQRHGLRLTIWNTCAVWSYHEHTALSHYCSLAALECDRYSLKKKFQLIEMKLIHALSTYLLWTDKCQTLGLLWEEEFPQQMTKDTTPVQVVSEDLVCFQAIFPQLVRRRKHPHPLRINILFPSPLNQIYNVHVRASQNLYSNQLSVCSLIPPNHAYLLTLSTRHGRRIDAHGSTQRMPRGDIVFRAVPHLTLFLQRILVCIPRLVPR
jgi:hypothetical protein